MKTLVLLLTATCINSLFSHCKADEITFFYEGTASGTLGGMSFDSEFLITAYANNDNIVDVGHGLYVENEIVTITIQELGSFDFVSETIAGVNLELGLSLLEVNAPPFDDIYVSPQSDELESWDLTSSIGPINGLSMVSDHGVVQTSGGLLTFDTGKHSGTFYAVVVPEPSWAIPFILGILFVSKRSRY